MVKYLKKSRRNEKRLSKTSCITNIYKARFILIEISVNILRRLIFVLPDLMVYYFTKQCCPTLTRNQLFSANLDARLLHMRHIRMRRLQQNDITQMQI